MRKVQLNTRRIVVDRSHETHTAVGVDTVRAVTVKEVPKDIIQRLKLRAKKAKNSDGYNLTLYSDDSSTPWKVWFRQFEDGRVIFSTKCPPGLLVHEFLMLLENNLGSWTLDAEFSRLDVHLTVPLRFKEFFNGLDFGRKRAVKFYTMNNKGQSFYVGKVKNKKSYELLIYDKQKESRFNKKSGPPIPYPCTRIEINTRPKKKMKVRELPLLLNHRPFKHVKRFSVTLKEPVVAGNKLHSRQRRDRFIELRTMYNSEGFFMTRRHLDISTSFNFHKNYHQLYELEELSPSLDELFAAGMKKFIKN